MGRCHIRMTFPALFIPVSAHLISLSSVCKHNSAPAVIPHTCVSVSSLLAYVRILCFSFAFVTFYLDILLRLAAIMTLSSAWVFECFVRTAHIPNDCSCLSFKFEPFLSLVCEVNFPFGAFHKTLNC